MSFALAFVGVVLGLLWLPGAVLIGLAVGAAGWLLGLVALCAGGWLALRVAGRLERLIPSNWSTTRRVAAAVGLGLAMGTAAMLMLAVASTVAFR